MLAIRCRARSTALFRRESSPGLAVASAAAGEAELKEGFPQKPPQKKETPRSSLDETHNRGYCEGTPYWAYLQIRSGRTPKPKTLRERERGTGTETETERGQGEGDSGFRRQQLKLDLQATDAECHRASGIAGGGTSACPVRQLTAWLRDRRFHVQRVL